MYFCYFLEVEKFQILKFIIFIVIHNNFDAHPKVLAKDLEILKLKMLRCGETKMERRSSCVM